MFEIGFWELLLISIIALFVFGPERLPGAIRTMSRNIRSVKNMMNNVKDELTREVSAQEARDLPPVITVNDPPKKNVSEDHSQERSFDEGVVITDKVNTVGNQ